MADVFVGAINARYSKNHVSDFDLTYEGLAPFTSISKRDASAAAIAASSLVELATYAPASKAAAYKAYANAAITALSTPPYKSVFAETEGAVMHCDAADVDVPWADYYLLEAIDRENCLVAGICREQSK